MTRKVIAGLLLLAASSFATADDSTRQRADEDERILEAANLGTNAADLLKYLREQTALASDEEKLKSLARQLGADSFQDRERASMKLTALGKIALPVLREAARSDDIEGARRAKRCIEQIEGDQRPNVVPAIVRRLAQLHPEGAAKAVLDYWVKVEPDSVEAVFADALTVLARQDRQALVSALADQDPRRRVRAAEALCRAGAGAQKDTIVALLRDPIPEVRLGVALALVPLQEKRAVEELIELLATVPAEQLGYAEDVLSNLAGDKAPAIPLGTDAASRKKCRDAWAAWWAANAATVDLTRAGAESRYRGYTLVVQANFKAKNHRVIEVDREGKIRWQIDNLQFPTDARVLPGNRVIITEYDGNRVAMFNFSGKVLWETKIKQPTNVELLPDGNLLIGILNGALVLDRQGRKVRDITLPYKEITDRPSIAVTRLPNGEMVMLTPWTWVRFDDKGQEKGRFQTNGGINFGSLGGLEPTPDNHVIIPFIEPGKFVEYDLNGTAVREQKAPAIATATRLPNGNTLVPTLGSGKIVEVDRKGKVVWEIDCKHTAPPRRVRRR
jgi:hypothetical protein